MQTSHLLIVFLFSAKVLTAQTIIDDQLLSQEFSDAIGKMAEDGESLSQEEASKMLVEVEGKHVALPDGGKPCSLDHDKSMYDRTVPAVVIVGSVYDCGNCDNWHMGRAATGWIASEDGLVVTNHHVLDGDGDNILGVMTPDGKAYPIMEILAADKEGDAAIMRIDSRGEKLPFLKLASHADVGDNVFTISNPNNRFFTYTAGVVSRFHYMQSRGESGPVFMTVTAEYAVGSSGAPVMNMDGEVVGMVSSTNTVTSGGSGSRRARDGEEEAAGRGAVQMVFRDCVSPQTFRKLVKNHE